MENPQGSDNSNNGGGTHGDRLSSLPDHILVDILSLLPTKTAVTTGVLSQRWRSLWTQTLNLDLDTRDFPNTKTCNNLYTIIDHILRQQLTSPQIRKFKLHVRKPANSDIISSAYWESFNSYIKPWMSLLYTRNVKEVEVISDQLLGIVGISSSSSSFECQSLVSLKLNQGFKIRVPDEINLPVLKKLFLCLDVCDSEWVRKLFRSCPLLEELSLEGYFSEIEGGEHFVEISPAPNLKRLSFQVMDLCRKSIKIAIDAPKLSFFNLSPIDGVKLWFVSQPSSSLEMRIICGSPREVRTIVKFFQEISNVIRSLTLHSAVIKTLVYLHGFPKVPFTLFRNLSSLSLFLEYMNHLRVFLGLLHCAPNLEFLAIKMLRGAETVKIGSIPLDSPPACLSMHVKRIHIGLIRGSEDGMGLVKYLLCHAKVLECLIVELSGEDISKEAELHEELELYEDLCKLPKSSPSCQIEVIVVPKLG